MDAWDRKREQVNSLVRELQGKPADRRYGHYLSAESILNAYREGDLLYDEAVSELKEWAYEWVEKHPATEQVAAQRQQGSDKDE